MIEDLSLPRPPNPIQKFRAPAGPTIAKWTERRKRTYHVSQFFQDLARHPWVGERQAGKAANLYTMTARGVDRELRALPYEQRLHLTRGGLWPIVVGGELGEGPNPWDAKSNRAYATQSKFHKYGGKQDVSFRSMLPPRGDQTIGPAATLPTKPLPKDPDGRTGDSAWARTKRIGSHAARALLEVGVTGAAAAAGTTVGGPAGGVVAANLASTGARMLFGEGAEPPHGRSQRTITGPGRPRRNSR